MGHLKLAKETDDWRHNISSHENNTKFTSTKKLVEFYNSKAFEEAQAKIDRAELAKKNKQPKPQDVVWLLWVVFKPGYEKAGVGRKLEGVYATERAIDERISKIGEYICFESVSKVSVGLKV